MIASDELERAELLLHQIWYETEWEVFADRVTELLGITDQAINEDCTVHHCGTCRHWWPMDPNGGLACNRCGCDARDNTFDGGSNEGA